MLQERVQNLSIIPTLCTKDDATVMDDTSIGNNEPCVTFEDQLSVLEDEWNKVLVDIESSRLENENIAKKWWDFSRSKKKIIRWMKKKEEDATSESSSEKNYDAFMETANKYKVNINFCYYVTYYFVHRFSSTYCELVKI